MARIEWNRPQDQFFEAGIDRGVIYVEDGPVVPWNGLASVDDSGESTVKEYYLDGIKYMAMVTPRDWAGTVKAYTYPDEFGELIGIDQMGDGFFVDSQAPDRFNLSYRTMVSAPNADNKKHYKIHLIYKVMASLGEFTNETLNAGGVEPVEFSFDLLATPIRIPGKRPSAHLIIDSRGLDSTILDAIEDLLYGNDEQEPVFPDIDDLIDMLTFSDTVKVVYNGDGTWTASGSNKNIQMLDNKGHFRIKNAPAEYISDDIYQFFGIESAAVMSLALDEDGIPYMRLAEGSTNIGIDSDGVPYFEADENGASIYTDTDGTPYVKYY